MSRRLPFFNAGPKQQVASHSTNNTLAKISSPSTFNYQPKLYCYTTTHSKANGTFFVYWKAESGILGVSDLGNQVFETKLDRKERRKFLKNVADSIVESKWR